MTGWFIIVFTTCLSGNGGLSIDGEPYKTEQSCRAAFERADMPQNPRCTAIVTCMDGKRVSKMLSSK